MQATLPRRSYDHRIREAICETRDPDLFPELRIPGSTIRSWLHRGATDVETVDVLHDDRLKLLAQIDVTYSNSMIEAFWRSLKHSWLYLHGLDTESELRRLIAFYVEAHNEVMPHSAFEGQTPNEVFFGMGDAIVAKLAAEWVQARTERLARNRSAGCGACIGRAG